MFSFNVSPLELFIRGSVMYWFLFFLFRVVLRRDTGAVGIADILVVVLVADAAQNGMAGEYKTLPEGMFLVATIAGWNYLIDWMSYRYEWFARLAEPRPLELVRNGKMLRRNMRKEMITPDDLLSQIREHGITNVAQVRQAWMEPDGHFSVIRYSEAEMQEKREDGR